MPKHDFKVGDRVSTWAFRQESSKYATEARTGTIVRVNSRTAWKPSVLVRWDDGDECNISVVALRKMNTDA